MAGTRDAILMVECGAKEIPEDVMVEALEFGHKAIQPLIDAAGADGRRSRQAQARTTPLHAANEALRSRGLQNAASRA